MSASKSNRGGFRATDEDIMMQAAQNNSSKKSSGQASKGGQKRIGKVDSENNLRDAINNSEILSSNVSNYSNGPAFRRQI